MDKYAKRLLLLAVALLSGVVSHAQDIGSDYYDDVAAMDMQEIDPEVHLFSAPVDGEPGVFSRLSEYNFSAVRYMRKGRDNSLVDYNIDGISLSDPLTNYIDFNVLNGVRRGVAIRRYGTSGPVGDIDGGVYSYSLMPAYRGGGARGAMFSANRNYRWGVRAAVSGVSRDDRLLYEALVYRRWGEDSDIPGVFTDETTVGAGLKYDLSGTRAITLYVVASPTQQGLRSSATREVFDLTGDNLYNPSWGYYGGDKRNSRVRKTFRPFFMATYSGRLGATDVGLSFAGRFGKSSYSALSWEEARNPNPDYYGYLPGYFDDDQQKRAVESAWIAGDVRYTQIDWAEMVAVNTMSGDRAHYILENRVENVRDVQARVRLSTVLDGLTINYGAYVRRLANSYYKEPEDMLAGRLFADGVSKGCRFGYDYDMKYTGVGVNVSALYAARRWRLRAGLEAESVAFRREGRLNEAFDHMERSGKMEFSPYSFDMSGNFYINPRHTLYGSLSLGGRAPAYNDVYLAPRWNNAVTDSPALMKVFSGEVGYGHTADRIQARVSAFATGISDGVAIYRYYDDAWERYADMVLKDVDRFCYGVEIGAAAKISPRLSLSLAGALGNYSYANDPKADLYAEEDGSERRSDETVLLKDYRLGGTPQSAATAEIYYQGYGNWSFSLEASYMADSYVIPAPRRRMRDVIMAGASSPESVAMLTDQERLPSAFTLSAALFKNFYMGHTRLFMVFSVDNILDNKGIVYSGHEQMRMRSTIAGYMPFDTKYLYGYGRRYYCMLSVNF